MRQIKISSWVTLAASALLALSVLPLPLRAQGLNTATLSGTVTDASGAAVPGAPVELVSKLQKFSRQTSTDAAGAYVMTAIPPGTYDMTVSANGFGPEKRTSIILSVGQASTLNFELTVAKAVEAVNVTSAPALLQTTDATLTSTLGGREIVQLPLPGRNFSQLMVTLPGVAPVPSNDSRNDDFLGTGLLPSMHGQRQRNNNYQLDGISNNNFGGNGVNQFPPPEALAEVNILSTMTSAAYGVGSGAAISVSTKSGTNRFHGDVWEFLQNDALNSRGAFVPSLGALHWNQFGGTLGGPISRDKGWYFFGYYEGIRVSRSANFAALVPTAAELAGDFSGGPTIFNPYTTTDDGSGGFVRQPFPNNQIPTGPTNLCSPNPTCINDSTLQIAQALYPTPNLPPGVIPGANFIKTDSNRDLQDMWGVRVDHQFNPSSNIFVRYSQNRQRSKTFDIYDTPNEQGFPNYNLAVSGTHLFSPTFVITGRFGITRHDRNGVPRLAPGLAENAGTLNSFTPSVDEGTNTTYNLIPNISIQSLAGLREFVSLPSPETQYYWSADSTKTVGSHTIGFGGFFQSYTHSSFNLAGGGSASFGSLQTGNFVGGTGHGFASFLLGLPQSANRQVGTSSGDLSGDAYGFYLQDDFRVTPRLTLNFGLRYDYAAPRVNKKGSGGFTYEDGSYWWNLPNPATGEAANVPLGVLVPDRNNFSPRLGIAYQISPKTVVRSSFGIFYNLFGFEYSQAQQGNRGNWPFASPESVSGINVSSPTTFFPNVFPNPPTLPLAPVGIGQNLNRWEPTSRTGYVQQWTLSLQRQLTPSLTLEANYAGSHGVKLDGQFMDNVALTPGPGDFKLRQKYPQLPVYITNGNNIFHSWYHAGSLQLEKRYTAGLSFNVNYTWSKNLTEMDSATNGGQSPNSWGASQPLWGTRFSTNRLKGPASFDIPQRLALSYIYDIPIKVENKFARAIVSNWTIAGITAIDNGVPFTPRLPFDNENIGATGPVEYPNLIGDPTISNPTRDRWFNTDAFAVPPAFTVGNSGKSILRGDGYMNWDLSLMKRWPFGGEARAVEFRAMFYNLANNVVYDVPNTNVGTPQFGTVSGMRNKPRSIAFQLKISF